MINDDGLLTYLLDDVVVSSSVSSVFASLSMHYFHWSLMGKQERH